jgi:hypothetical protein
MCAVAASNGSLTGSDGTPLAFRTITDFVIDPVESGAFGVQMRWLSATEGVLTTFPWWDHLELHGNRLEEADWTRPWTIDDPYADADQDWAFLAWVADGFVYVRSGTDVGVLTEYRVPCDAFERAVSEFRAGLEERLSFTPVNRTNMPALILGLLQSTLGKPVHAAHRLWTAINERLLNIETGHSATGVGARYHLPNDRGIHPEESAHGDNVYYEPLNYLYVRRMLRLLELRNDDVLYDIGCGKGRILCVAARSRLKKVVGVELFEELCAEARANARRLRGRNTAIEVICGDATTIDYDDGTVFVLYNPFGEATMASVIAKLRDSVRRKPRNLRIGYYMPVCEHILAAEPWLEKYDSFETMSCSASLWRSRAPDN